MEPAPPYPRVTLIERLFAALRLDRSLYEEASLNPDSLGQAVMVVLLGGALNGAGLMQRIGDAGIWAGIFAASLGWLAWTTIIGLLARLLRLRREGRSLLRPLAFGTAPNVFLVLVMFQEYARWVRFGVVVWLMATSVVAVQAVYGVGRARAVALALVAFLIYAGLDIVVNMLLGS
jgi:hypothetical protein